MHGDLADPAPRLADGLLEGPRDDPRPVRHVVLTLVDALERVLVVLSILGFIGMMLAIILTLDMHDKEDE